MNRVNEVDKVKDRGENRSDTNKCINGKGGLKNKEVGYLGDEKSVDKWGLSCAKLSKDWFIWA